VILLHVIRQHGLLPRLLRVGLVVPFTLALVIFSGLTFTLPAGPLCDEGMVLFMEGSCDYGGSNIFFHSKLGLLIALNLVFVLAWRSNVREVDGFGLHVLVLLGLTLLNLSESDCENYYGRPNGNTGQMLLEGSAFAGVGMAFLLPPVRRSWPRLVAFVAAWNALHVAVFYAGLSFTDHWTWTHTFFICAVLGGCAGAVAMQGRISSPASRTGED
jgi:hypothetical protein